MNKMLKSRHCVNIYVNVCMYACTHYVSMHACLHAITLHGRFFTVAYAILRSECLWNALWKQGWVELQHLGRQWYFVFIRLGRWGKWMGASNAWFLAAFPTSPQGELQSLQSRVLVSVGSTHSQSPGTVLLAAEERWDQKEEERRHVRLETNREMSPNKFPQSLREWAARASALGKGEWLRASLRTQPWLCEIPPAFWLSPQAMRSEMWDSENEAVMFLAFFTEAENSKELQVYWSRHVTLAADQILRNFHAFFFPDIVLCTTI